MGEAGSLPYSRWWEFAFPLFSLSAWSWSSAKEPSVAIEGTAGTGWSLCPLCHGPKGTALPGAVQGWGPGLAPGVHGHISPGLVSELQMHKLGKSGAKWLQQDFAFLAEVLLQQDFMLAPANVIFCFCFHTVQKEAASIEKHLWKLLSVESQSSKAAGSCLEELGAGGELRGRATALVHAGRSARPGRGEHESSLDARCQQVQVQQQPLPKQPLVVSTASWLQNPPSLSPRWVMVTELF